MVFFCSMRLVTLHSFHCMVSPFVVVLANGASVEYKCSVLCMAIFPEPLEFKNKILDLKQEGSGFPPGDPAKYCSWFSTCTAIVIFPSLQPHFSILRYEILGVCWPENSLSLSCCKTHISLYSMSMNYSALKNGFTILFSFTSPKISPSIIFPCRCYSHERADKKLARAQ